MGLSHHREKPVLVQTQPTFHENPQILTVWRPASTLTQHISHPFAALPVQE